MFCTRDLTAIECPAVGTLPLLGISLRELNHGFPQLLLSEVPFPTPNSKAMLGAPGTQMPQLYQYTQHGHMGTYGCTSPGPHHPAVCPAGADHAQQHGRLRHPVPPPLSIPRTKEHLSSSRSFHSSASQPRAAPRPPRWPASVQPCHLSPPSTAAHRPDSPKPTPTDDERVPGSQQTIFPDQSPSFSPALASERDRSAAARNARHRAPRRLAGREGSPQRHGSAPDPPRTTFPTPPPRNVPPQCHAARGLRAPGTAPPQRLESRAAPVRARTAAEPRRRAARPALTGFFLRRLWSRLTTRSVYSTGFRVRERWGQP